MSATSSKTGDSSRLKSSTPRSKKHATSSGSTTSYSSQKGKTVANSLDTSIASSAPEEDSIVSVSLPVPREPLPPTNLEKHISSAEKSSAAVAGPGLPTARKFTPRLPRFEEHGWIPSSKRLRSLDGVKPFIVRGEKKFGHLEKTYTKRQFREDDDERKMAVALMSYLRLQPYTGRPCLGLVHMARRVQYAGKIAMKSLWYRDVARERPSAWVNEISTCLRYIGRKMCVVRVRGCLDHLEVMVDSRLNAPFTLNSGALQGQQLSIMIPFNDVVRNLSKNAPFLLSSFLTETITNTYTRTTIDEILDYVEFQVPGFGQGENGYHRSTIAKPNLVTAQGKPVYALEDQQEEKKSDFGEALCMVKCRV